MVKHSVTLPDKKLWENFLLGDSTSFKLIYERSIYDLLAYGRSFCQDQEVVKDSIHDLFIELHNTRSRLGKTDKILPYLMVILKRILIKKLRKKETNRLLDIERLPFILDICEDETDLDGDDNFVRLKKALDELTPRQREAIHLKYSAGLSYEELSKVMNLNYQTSRNLIFRAIQKLRVILNENQVVVLLVVGFVRAKRK